MSFISPKKEDIAKFNKKSLSGVIYNLKLHADADSDWGVFTIDTAISILETLAENMKDEQTLSEYFDN